MDRVWLFPLDMRWKSWYLEYIEHELQIFYGDIGLKFRGRSGVTVDLGQLVTRIAHRLPLCEIYRLRIGLTEGIMSFWWNDHRSPWEEKPVCGVERWKSLKQGHKP
ncbi:uncharacterized protein [Physcomitrium patens]|uniref:Uncharacterized protein n=1 Tax=Physcomitrium patens TaxID=3218 RepID=A0A2K1KHY4_PHYPA|nr:hypothetical protein PHYPA_007069 [Physcomitrium patens]